MRGRYGLIGLIGVDKGVDRRVDRTRVADLRLVKYNSK